MPYLKITSLALDPDANAEIARRLTNAVNTLLYNPKGGHTREELMERTTVHFVPYQPYDFYIGGRPAPQRDAPDVTVELSDWSMSVKQQRRVATALTPILAELFQVGPDQIESINIRFHSYPPTDFAVGGRLLSDLIPFVAKVAKRLLG
ncbi:hypothetical protein [uncultured Fibrella sp.]|uniref:hypothetical protein n=1 Tax=uncultured Fibrella sp. TaxID=1284596 RepID=UPI0035CAC907